MAYQGIGPASFNNNLTNVQLLDDISSSFNGSTQTFALTANSSPFRAVSARSLLVTLGGVTQEPNVDYTVDGSNITFTTAPASGLTFAARNIYGLNALNIVNDGTITPSKLSLGGPSWNTSGTLSVSGDLNVTGSLNTGAQGLFWGDNEKANFGDGNELQIYYDGNSYVSNTDATSNLFVTSALGLQLRVNSSHAALAAIGGAQVELFYANNKKLETTNSGITVTGSIVTDDASVYPDVRPVLDLNFAATKQLDPRITFVREGYASYVDEQRLVRYSEENTPRFDHDPVTGESLGLLIEKPQFNYIDNSRTSSGWSPSRGDITEQTTVVSPDGTTNHVFLFTEDTQTGPHHFKAPTNTPVWGIADATTVTVSGWFKKYGSKNVIAFGLNKKDDSYHKVNVNLDTGTLSNIPTGHSATITAYPNGWYRVSLTGDGGTGTTRNMPVYSLFLVENGSSTLESYTGDGVSGVYVWGLQLETSEFASTYIPTDGESTRGYRGWETAQILNSNFSNFYNADEGTIVIRTTPLYYASGTNDRLVVIEEETLPFTSGSGVGGINLDVINNSGVRTETFLNGSFHAGLSSAVGVGNNKDELTIALTYAENNYSLTTNGVVRGTDTTYTVPTPMAKIGIGNWSNNSGAGANIHIRYFKYYAKTLSTNQLEFVTSQ